MYSLKGHSVSGDDKITRKFTYERGDGFQTDIRVRDDGSNTFVEYLNPGDDRNSANGRWTHLLAGLTTGTTFGFTAFNDTGTDNLLFCNAVDNFKSWIAAICVVSGALSAAASTVPVLKVSGDPKTNATDNFPSSGSFCYVDTAGAFKTITYSGKTNTTFTGCSGVTATAANTGLSNVVTDQSGIPKNNILITAQGRVWAAGRTDKPNELAGSLVSDFTNWSAATTPAGSFVLDFPEGGKITALASKDSWVFVGKESRVLAVAFDLTTVADGSGGTVLSKSDKQKIVARIGIVNQKAVALVQDDIIFISPEGEIRRLFRLEAENEFSTFNINGEVRPSLVDSNFSDASLEYFPKKDVLVAAFRKDANSTINDYGEFIYFVKNEQGEVANINISFHDIFIADMNVYNKNLKFGSTIESRDFRLFDGFVKNGAPYKFQYVTRIEDNSQFLGGSGTFIQKLLKHLLVKGSIGSGTTLTCKINYDDNASTAQSTMTIADSDGTPYVVSQVLNTLNAFPLGNSPLGGTLSALPNLNPFKVFFALANQYRPYNYQIEFETDGAGQIVEIDTHGFDVERAANTLPNHLYKKAVG